MTHAFLDCLS